ncbi:aminotransferase class V-fold PLP-dependent enzyme [bacterium]|nr:aminotransferase class V-fold PLP-dependent enzyme [bacterium]
MIACLATEHPSVLEPVHVLAERGVSKIILPVKADASIDLQQCLEQLTEDTVLCCMMLANNEVGTIYPVQEFAAQAKSDLDSIGEDSSRRKKKKRSRVRGKRDELSRWDELVAAAKLAKNEEAAKQEQQLASPNLSSVIERNLFWVALAIVGGLISVFFTIRRNRKSTDMKL